MGPREPVERPGDLHESIPFPPMEAELVRELPEGDEWQYEPKWDGFRGLLENGTGDLRLWSRNARPLLRYFPELRPLEKLLPPLSALDGEIVIERDGVLDFDAMQMRLHPAESRINRLAGEIPARFIAFDVLVWKGVEAWREPLSKRRARLERSAKRFELSPATRDREDALDWLERFEAIGLDGVIAKRRDVPYLPGSRDGVVKVKPERTADAVVVGVRWKSKPDRIATLLLGLYGDDGDIDYVGSAAVGRAGVVDHDDPSAGRAERLPVVAVELPAVGPEFRPGVENLAERLLDERDVGPDGDFAAELLLQIGSGGEVIGVDMSFQNPFDPHTPLAHMLDDAVG